MGGKAVRYPQYPRPADSSERGNPDYSEAISGENRTSFLSEEEAQELISLDSLEEMKTYLDEINCDYLYENIKNIVKKGSE